MTTRIAKPLKERSDLRTLRDHAERQMRDLAEKMKAMQALLERLNAAVGAPPQTTPLDEVHELVETTEDLRVRNGNLSAAAVTKAFGISMNQLATWLGRTRQALTKTPDADSLQNDLAYFERVARLRAVVSQDRFLKWLRMPHEQLDGKSPLDLMAEGQRQVVVDFVEDMLTGAPT
jgi:uncharacterized protein (DUF2384 family)